MRGGAGGDGEDGSSEGGGKGGTGVCSGTPEEVAKVKQSYTGQFVKEVLKGN